MNGPLGIRIFPRLRSTRLGPYPAAVHNNQAAVVFMLPQGNKDAVFVQLHHFALVFAAVFRTIQRSIAGMVAVFVQDNLPESVPGFTLVPGHGNVVGITVREHVFPRSVAGCGVFRQSHRIRPQGNDGSVIQAAQRIHGQGAEKAGRFRFAPCFTVIPGESLPRLVQGSTDKRPQRTVLHLQNRGFHGIVEPSDTLVGGPGFMFGGSNTVPGYMPGQSPVIGNMKLGTAAHVVERNNHPAALVHKNRGAHDAAQFFQIFPLFRIFPVFFQLAVIRDGKPLAVQPPPWKEIQSLR